MIKITRLDTGKVVYLRASAIASLSDDGVGTHIEYGDGLYTVAQEDVLDLVRRVDAEAGRG